MPDLVEDHSKPTSTEGSKLHISQFDLDTLNKLAEELKELREKSKKPGGLKPNEEERLRRITPTVKSLDSIIRNNSDIGNRNN